MRRELAGSGVTVTHVNPRAARTPFNNAQVNRFLDITGMKADEPGWVAVQLRAGAALRRPVTLDDVKADSALAGMVLLRQSRLSVQPVAPAEFARIVRLGGGA